MDIYAVREGLATAAATVVMPAGAAQLTVTPYLPDSVSEPHFFVADYTIDYDKAMNRAQDVVEFTCRLLVGRTDEQTSQRIVDTLFSGSGTSSLKAALESARGAPGEAALGGACDDFHVTRMTGNRWYQHAGNEYVGGELTIKVIGSGD